MKNSNQTTFRLTRQDWDNEAEPAPFIEFTPLIQAGAIVADRVSVYFSDMGDDNIRRIEVARQLYRTLISEGWTAA